MPPVLIPEGNRAGLFSTVNSAFIIDVQSKLQPDQNEMTAAYMQILIHAVKNSLFPDANPESVTWTANPPSTSASSGFEKFPEVQVRMVLFADWECSGHGSQWACSSHRRSIPIPGSPSPGRESCVSTRLQSHGGRDCPDRLCIIGSVAEPLRRSNFTSFEEIVSTRDGKRTALRYMLNMANKALLRTAANIATAIRRFEELQCSNTAEVVIMWAWTLGVVNPVDHDGWWLIGLDILRFYQIYGVERLTVLKRRIADKKMFLLEQHGESGVEIFFELPVLKPYPDFTYKYLVYAHLSQACWLRRLYQLFGYDPTTWEEAVVVEEVDERTESSSGQSSFSDGPGV